MVSQQRQVLSFLLPDDSGDGEVKSIRLLRKGEISVLETEAREDDEARHRKHVPPKDQ